MTCENIDSAHPSRTKFRFILIAVIAAALSLAATNAADTADPKPLPEPAVVPVEPVAPARPVAALPPADIDADIVEHDVAVERPVIARGPARLTLSAPGGGLYVAAPAGLPDSPDAPPVPVRSRARVAVISDDDSSVDERLERLERMIEKLADQRAARNKEFAFNFSEPNVENFDDVDVDVDFQKADQFARVHKDMEKANREMEKVTRKMMKDLKPQIERQVVIKGKGVAGAERAKGQRKALEAQRKSLEKQLKAVEKRLNAIEKEEQGIKDDGGDSEKSESKSETRIEKFEKESNEPPAEKPDKE